MNKIRIGIFLSFFTIFGFVLFVGGTIPYYLFYIFLLTFLIPLIHTIVTLKGLGGKVEIPDVNLFTGENIDINYSIENNSIFGIPYLEIYSEITKKLLGKNIPRVILSLGKKENYYHKETVTLKRRGYYQLGEIHLTLQDVFKFYTFRKTIVSNISLLVYPETINLSTFKITSSQQMGELLVNNSMFKDKSRIESLREYNEGDSIKSIHWKLSAKKDNPIVKSFESRVDTNSFIFIDNYKELFKDDVDRRLEDKAVDISLSIINYYLNHNIPLVLNVQNEEELIEISGAQNSNLKPFLDVFARFSGNGSKDSAMLLVPIIERFRKGTTLIIITPNLDKTMGSIGIQLVMKNLNPVFIAISDEEFASGYIDPTVEKRLKQEGIPVYIIDYLTSIKEALEVHHG